MRQPPCKGDVYMDTERAKEILTQSGNIQVLYDGTPVWLENIKDNNTVQVTYLDTHRREDVPVYKLVEVNPQSIH